MPRVVVLVLTYDSEGDVERCFGSLRRAVGGRDDVAVLAVDNASRDRTVELLAERFPEVERICNPANLGFSRGVNLGLARARAAGAELVYLLNPDTEVEPGFLDGALAAIEGSPDLAAVQSLILLDPDRDRIDSAGNAQHFLGFGYCVGHGRPRSEVPAEPAEIAFASGAASLFRLDALAAVGDFDASFFLYCEDLDLGWRLRLAGFRALLAPDSVVFHRHEFSRTPEKFFHLERNRPLAVLKNGSLRLLAAWLVASLACEPALALVAWRHGWLRQKARAWAEWLRPATWHAARVGRRRSRALRRVPDREVARPWTARMEVAGERQPLVLRLTAPAQQFYWSVVRALL